MLFAVMHQFNSLLKFMSLVSLLARMPYVTEHFAEIQGYCYGHFRFYIFDCLPSVKF
jgi:hypothetical protein